MIYLNQIKDTRYLVQIALDEDFLFDLRVMLFFKYFHCNDEKVNVHLGSSNIDSIILNGKRYKDSLHKNKTFLVPKDKLNNNSDNIISFRYLEKLNCDLLIISNSNEKFKEYMFSTKYNISKQSLPSFNHYTFKLKYRLVVTIPRLWKIFNETKPFDFIYHGDKKIVCFENFKKNTIDDMNLIINPVKHQALHK